jgi:hypothetical protein
MVGVLIMQLTTHRHEPAIGNSSTLFGCLLVAFGLGIATATGQGVAWADTSGGAGGSVSNSGASTGAGTQAAPKSSAGQNSGAAGHRPNPSDPSSLSSPGKSRTIPGVPGTSSTSSIGDGKAQPSDKVSSPAPKGARGQNNDDANAPAVTTSAVAATDADSPAPQQLSLAATDTAAPLSPSSATTTTAVLTDIAPAPLAALFTTPGAPSGTPTIDKGPGAPAPVSAAATIVALPGRIVNGILQVLGMTTSTSGPTPIPINPFPPLFDLVFAAFRRLENIAGLDSPVAQPHLVTQTYTGPLGIETPTVAQFLNAATAEYVLGGVPGGMKPLTIDGWPVRETKEFTGMTAQVWVTPQQQVIIAYSGTTSGTNILFNPLISVFQSLTDAQGIRTSGTPQAFHDALDFAREVQAEAARQGYEPDDVFVTGHSLGAWEAEYVAQNTGLAGIGFEGPGLNNKVEGNGADSLFVNTATYGDIAAFAATDLPGMQPVVPAYVPAGGAKPHYGPIVMLGDPSALTPMTNAAALFGTDIVRTLLSAVFLLGNMGEYHLPGNQAYNLDVTTDPGVVPWLGVHSGPILYGFDDLTIPEFLKAASDEGILVTP